MKGVGFRHFLTQWTLVRLMTDSAGEFCFQEGPPPRSGETTSAQRSPFPLQAELIKLLSPVAQNSRLKYFSFKKVKPKSCLNQRLNDLNSSFSVFKMLDVLITKRHDQHYLAPNFK